MKADHYRRHAASCILIAEASTDPDHRGRVMMMAAAWARLAEQAERNARSDFACEMSDQPVPAAVQ